MERNGYIIQEWDINNHWRYWCKEPIDGGYSWFRCVIERSNDDWFIK